MGLFDRRKDANVSTSGTREESAAEETRMAAAPPAPEPGQPEPPPTSVEAPTTATKSGPAIHTVAAGESLADLSTKYGVPAEEIARQNHVPPPGQIHAGQVFVIRS